MGQDLTTYVGRHDVLQTMTSDTRNQLQLSVELAELVRKSKPDKSDQALRQVVNQCLGRDPGWKEFYNTRIRKGAKQPANINPKSIQLAEEERESHRMAASNNGIDAKRRFQKAINAAGLADEELAVYLQRLARIAYLVDPAEGLKIQQGARERSPAVAIPPSAPRKPSAPGAKTVAEKFCAWFLKFSSGNAAVIEAQRIADSLDLNGKHHQVEAALKDLGEALGADSSRPEVEYDAGPDNLWFWGGAAFVIEAKNENQESLHKSDSGQLHDSLQWARTNYPAFARRLHPITVARVTKADADAHYPEGTRVLTQDGCTALGIGLNQLCQKLAAQGPVFVTPENVLAEMGNFGLLAEQFIGRHTKKPD